MLKQALLVLEQLSPRLCRLIAQIWDLTSLNFFVLIQLAHATIEENEQLHMKSRNAEHFQEEMVAQQTQRLQRHEIEIDKMRLDNQNLRAELQKTRQKQNRLAVENSQLRQAISGLTDTQDSLSDTAADGGFIAHVEFEDDITVVGDAEEREFYGVNGDELDKVEKIHPIESLSQDLELLFQGLAGQERLQMATLNDLDRFINSNTVSLLWQYGSSEEEHRLMHRMMNAKTIGSQTDAVEPERHHGAITNNSNGTESSVGAAQSSEDDLVGSSGGVYTSGETGNATLVTKRQTIPTSLRAQLETRPKIQRVLEKDQLNRIILRIYLEKLDADAVAVRARRPRVELHHFMKQFFLERYGIAPLADYHMMEVVKSCLFYNEHLEVEHRKIKALGLPASRLAGCYPLHDSNSGNQFSASDIRFALFSRICELVPPELADVPVGGNLFSCLLNVLLDMIGDIVEMDGSVNSLEQVFKLPTEERWDCSTELALELLSHHLVFVERRVLEDVCARILQLSTAPKAAYSTSSAAGRISVDVFLAIFISTWLEHDQRLTKKLRDGFKRQLVALSPFAASDGKNPAVKAKAKRDHGDGDSSSSNDSVTQQLKLTQAAASALKEAPLESLMSVCSTLPDESLSPLDLDEIRTSFQQIVEANHELVDPGRTKKKTAASVRKTSVVLAAPAGVCIGGVSEKEFVSITVQILRTRRNCFGIRTHSRLLSTVPLRMSQLGASRQLVALISSHEYDGDLPLKKLKPGLERAKLAK